MLYFTREYFESVGITVEQPGQGYRYGEASLALADFCRVESGERVAELGSGCGVISMLIAARDHPDFTAAVEIQPELHQVAARNVETNGLGGVISCVCDDWRQFAVRHRRSFHVVVANPPFYAAGSGRLSNHPQRAVAHHEIHGTLSELLDAARTMLIPSGRLVLVFPKARRQELLQNAELKGFHPRRVMLGPLGSGIGPSFLVEFERLSLTRVRC